MRSLLKTHSWFVLLITLVMGWSGIAQASAAPMHQMMQLSIQAATGMQSMPDCHQTKSSSPVSGHQMHMAQTDMTAKSNCHASDMLQNKQVQCQECAQYHCQTTLTLLYVEPLAVVQLEAALVQSSPHFRYQAQHLVGYWQEILRPPKA
ncbi:hypothetical protein N5D11_10080 [Acinetobacter johnsonii]|uniref:DUF2946 domain-containing protein n=1 Tax=Acinetobacter johnsonii TaxID=40214 RepID=A0AA42IF71_ACIJO|nr:hypothetical protein [Acinetobacter johnsonii]MDH0656462.1 hypothetical protein [Acinetobacter johnsonii]